MNDKELCQWLRDNSSGTYRPSAEAADRIEALNIELAVMKAAIPQIQHDAVIDAVRKVNYYPDNKGDWVVCTDDLYSQARQLLTQAKEQGQ